MEKDRDKKEKEEREDERDKKDRKKKVDRILWVSRLVESSDGKFWPMIVTVLRRMCETTIFTPQVRLLVLSSSCQSHTFWIESSRRIGGKEEDPCVFHILKCYFFFLFFCIDNIGQSFEIYFGRFDTLL